MNQVVAELVQEVQSGNGEKIIELWEKFKPLWIKWSRRYAICGYESVDLEQQSYMILLDCLRGYDSARGVPFEGYYQLALRHWALGEYRKKKNQPMMDLGELEDVIEDEQMSVEQEVGRLIQRQALIRALEELTRVEQQIVIGFYIEGCSLGELAQRLGFTYKAIEKRKAAILLRLRKKLVNGLGEHAIVSI